MRKKATCFILIILLLISPFISTDVKGQTPDPSVVSNDYYKEKIVINTDRSIYIAGEKVLVKLFKMDGNTCRPADVSKVVYLEMLDDSNNPLNQARIRVEGTSGSAAFRLSDTLRSGNYLLRAYTSWMENFSEHFFSYISITVLNPFKSLRELSLTDTEKANNSDLSYTWSDEYNCDLVSDNHIIVKTTLDKKKYGTRDAVKLDISVSGADGRPVKADLSVSVVKAFLERNDGKYLQYKFEDDLSVNDPSEFPSHLPELEGEMIRGKLLNKITNVPLKDTDISLSIVGKTARCQFARTNAKGEFIFVVKDQIGVDEIVIQPVNPDITDSYVELHQPYSNTSNGFKPPVFNLEGSNPEQLNNAVISMQVNNLYEQTRDKKTIPEPFEMLDFFGKSVRTIKMSDYIELKNIREVVKEILPEVSVFRKEGKMALKVISKSQYQIFENEALVLFDGVPVSDIEKLMEVTAKELEKIEIINSRYFYSGYVFEGIISFVSKEGNSGAIESVNSGLRQVFEGCLKPEIFYSPDYNIDSLRLSRIPDFRNTLFWKPDIITTADGSATVEFYTSDEKTDYVIVISGFDPEGHRVHYATPLVVE